MGLTDRRKKAQNLVAKRVEYIPLKIATRGSSCGFSLWNLG